MRFAPHFRRLRRPLRMSRCVVLWSAVTATVVLVAVSSTPAQPAPSVSGGAVSIQRGQTLDRFVSGSSLGGVSSVGLAEPQGLDVSLATPEKDAKPNDAQARLKVVAAPDAAPGEREVRLI